MRICTRQLETCRTCGCTAKVVAYIEDPAVIEKILTDLYKKNTSAEAPRLPPCRAPPQAGLFD